MTKKDFEKLAALINGNWALFNSEQARKSFALAMAALLQGTNPRFDQERFLQACGIGQPAYVNSKGKTVNY